MVMLPGDIGQSKVLNRAWPWCFERKSLRVWMFEEENWKTDIFTMQSTILLLLFTSNQRRTNKMMQFLIKKQESRYSTITWILATASHSPPFSSVINSSSQISAPCPPDPSRKLHILCHDSHAFRVNGAELRIFEQMHQNRLAALLQGLNRLRLPPQRFSALEHEGEGNFPDLWQWDDREQNERNYKEENKSEIYDAGKGQFEEKKIGGGLVATNLAQGNGARAISMRLSWAGGGVGWRCWTRSMRELVWFVNENLRFNL